jgi:pantothenate kinase
MPSIGRSAALPIQTQHHLRTHGNYTTNRQRPRPGAETDRRAQRSRVTPATRMTAMSVALDDLIQRAQALIGTSRRVILGITGTPGAGKSTLCAALLDTLGQDAVLVSMDGFHFANQELVRLGRRDRKGAPDTFDVDGYTALLRRLRKPADAPIYAPVFNREIEESIGSAIPVPANTPLVITEGNYLLLDGHGWEAVRGCLDEVWYLDIDPELREQRLLLRRQSFGESTAKARAWVSGVDEANASIVESTRGRADLLIHLRTEMGGGGAIATPSISGPDS